MPGVGVLDPRTFPGLWAAFRPEALVGLADGATVSTWNDLSDAGRHITALGGTPLVKTRATGSDLNGFPVVRYSGTLDRHGLVAAGTSFARPFTMLAVAKNSVADDGLRHAVVACNSGRESLSLSWATAGNFYNSVDDNSDNANGPMVGDVGVWHIHSVVFRPAGQFTIRSVDGIRVQYAGVAGAPTADNIEVGARAGTELWNGDIAEAHIYRGEFPFVALREAEYSLARKFNLTSQYKLNG